MKLHNGFKFFLMIISATVMSCNGQNMEDKFDWSATLSAPQEYPIEVYKGEISGEGYGQTLAHFGPVSVGWGNEGGAIASGPEQKNLPDYLGLTWVSFAEKKVYSGQFTLPKDKITQLFKEGFGETGAEKKSTYNTFVIGLAPKGNVVVWIAGDGNQVEVAKFNAAETKIDTASLSDEDKHMFTVKYVDYVVADPMIVKPSVQQKIKTKGYPPVELFTQTYREKYHWAPKIILPEGYKLTAWEFLMCNGEKEYMLNGASAQSKTERALPYLLTFAYTDEAKNKYEAFVVLSGDEKYLPELLKDGDAKKIPIDFEENEIRGLMKDKLDKNLPAELQIHADPQKKMLTLDLKQQAKTQPIHQFKYLMNSYGGKYN
ncbi:DUF2931 family protein [Pedobacter sp. AW1-32]|uniref:DUF2931 family protein n=1 Tax=Pedobacter sp. AW1-32 TaxID=3383026 RepID=UPI003FF05B01